MYGRQVSVTRPKRRGTGHGTPGPGAIERPDHLDRAEHGVIRALGVEGEGLKECRCELPDGAIAGPKEVNRVIVARP